MLNFKLSQRCNVLKLFTVMCIVFGCMHTCYRHFLLDSSAKLNSMAYLDRDNARTIEYDTSSRPNPTTKHGRGILKTERTDVNNFDINILIPSQKSGHDEYLKIAVGGALTLKNMPRTILEHIKTSYHMVSVFLPSFCSTASDGPYEYAFYFAYDYNDPYLSKDNNLVTFLTAFKETVEKFCLPSMTITLRMIKVYYSGKPAFAQNDAMMAAYLDGADYFYRVNDDTWFITENWTEKFIAQLAAFNPPNVGVVGPNHDWGRRTILTYDFVHRTHVDIFGFYYPREFESWYADQWITEVYTPGNAKKLEDVLVSHHHMLGTRYELIRLKLNILLKLLPSHKDLVRDYIVSMNQSPANSTCKQCKISMAVGSLKPKYLWGVIRNAQLVPRYFYGWMLIVYFTDEIKKHGRKYSELLLRLGAEVRILPSSGIKDVPWSLWSLLTLDDKDTDAILFREPEQRLGKEERALVNDWLNTNTSVHCLRTLPTHTEVDIVPHLWGVRPKHVLSKFASAGKDMLSILRNASGRSDQSDQSDQNFLATLLLPIWNLTRLCHDLVNDPLPPFSKRPSYYKNMTANFTSDIGKLFDEHMGFKKTRFLL